MIIVTGHWTFRVFVVVVVVVVDVDKTLIY